MRLLIFPLWAYSIFVFAMVLTPAELSTVFPTNTPGAENPTGPYLAAQGRNSINGIITDANRRPVNRIRVELLNEVDMLVATTYTDAGGRYNFNNLTQGNFVVKVVPSGDYVAQSIRVQLYYAGGSGAQFEQVNFVLKSALDSKDATAPANAGMIFAQSVPEDARKAYELAVTTLDSGRDSEAGIAQLKEALNLFPTYYLALERLGAEYVKREQFEQARETLGKAIEVNPKGALSHYALGVTQIKLKQYTEAINSLRRSLVLAPDSQNAPSTYYYLGLGLVRTGKTDEAEAEFKRAYEKGAKRIPSDVHMHLAQIYSNSKRYKEAADELELFLKETPNARDAESIKNIIKQLRAKAK
jgi:tetratricopeptide (TPR) repeat protein